MLEFCNSLSYTARHIEWGCTARMLARRSSFYVGLLVRGKGAITGERLSTRRLVFSSIANWLLTGFDHFLGELILGSGSWLCCIDCSIECV
jgi:hypothetical protein